MLDTLLKSAQTGVIVLTIGGVIVGGGYALHTVDTKLNAMEERLTGKMNVVDVKMAGIKETITLMNIKEGVDTKVAGLEKGVDAKVAGIKEGVTKELDAKMAGIADKAKAEALLVMKDYGVSTVSQFGVIGGNLLCLSH